MKRYWKRGMGTVAVLLAVVAVALPGSVALAQEADSAPAEEAELTSEGRVVLHGTGKLLAIGGGRAHMLGDGQVYGSANNATLRVKGAELIRINNRATVATPGSDGFVVIRNFSGQFYVAGNDMEVDIQAPQMHFIARGRGTVGLFGHGHFRVNGSPWLPWPSP